MKAGQYRVLKKRVHVARGVRPKADLRMYSIKEGRIMRCHRCSGMMVYEKFYGDCEYFFGWRCVVCGEIVNQIILENRLDSIQ